MSNSGTVESVIELGRRHVRLESERQLEPLMQTMVAEPLYEFHTLGLRLQGGESVRRYYRQFFEDYMSKVTGGRRLGWWASESAYVLETEIHVSTPRGPERQRVIAVLFAEGNRLGGERVYAAEGTVRMMAGRMFEELEAIP